MPRYEIAIERNAIKSLRKAPPRIRKAVEQAIDGLADEPRPHGIRTLDAGKKLYRLRVGSYRIVYQVQDARLVVLVVRVGDRKEVYRRLDALVKRTPPP